MTAIQDGDFVVAGGAASSASTVIVAGGAVPAAGAEDLTIQAGSADADGFRSGQYQLTGYELGGVLQGVQQLETGSLVIAGSAVDAAVSRLLQAAGGELGHSGYDWQGIRFARTLDAETRVLVLDGYGLTTKLNLALGADTGNVALTGFSITAIGQRFALLDEGLIGLAGYEIETRRNPQITPTSGGFTLAGYELSTLSDTSISVDSGQTQTTGYPVDLQRVTGIALDTAVTTLTGYPIELNQQKLFIETNSGFIAFSGGVLNFTLTRAEVFGANRPTSRRFRPGGFFFSRSETFSGSESRRIWSTTAQNAVLDLEYNNIFESTALEMLQLYEKCYGGYASVALPSEVLSGAEESIKDQVRLSGTKMRWYFAEPPRIRAVFPGVCDVSVRFTGKVSYER